MELCFNLWKGMVIAMSKLYDGSYDLFENQAKSFFEQGDYRAAENCFFCSCDKSVSIMHREAHGGY